MYPLNNYRALVCGSTQGMGRACAESLAALGAHVTLLARNADSLAQVQRSLPTPNQQRHDTLVADFADPKLLDAAVRRQLDASGPVHILINNTGGPPGGPIADATGDQLLQAFSNHVLCSQLLAQAVIPGMKAAAFGRIVNIVSTSVIAPIKGLGVSNTIRGAVANWARTLAGELATFGITVNNILPGFVATARLTTLFQKRAEAQRTTLSAIEDQARSTIPMGRFATASEIGEVVAFLCTPAASYVTGVNLPVDGGRTAVQG